MTQDGTMQLIIMMVLKQRMMTMRMKMMEGTVLLMMVKSLHLSQLTLLTQGWRRIWGRQGFDDSDYSSPEQVGPLDSTWNSPRRGGRPQASLQPACWSGEDLMGKRSSPDDILMRKRSPNLDVSSIPLNTTDPVAHVGLPEQGHLSQVPHLQ